MIDPATLTTQLKGRILYGDGDSIVELPFLYNHLLSGGKVSEVFVSKEDFEENEVQTYNKKFMQDQVLVKNGFREVSHEWIIPKRFKELNLSDYLFRQLKREVNENEFTDDEITERFYRTKMELRIWKKRNMLDLLRTLIYIVNTFEEHNITWGAGRGSSCASYVLYLIGLHQVDSVFYDLDIGEFFR